MIQQSSPIQKSRFCKIKICTSLGYEGNEDLGLTDQNHTHTHRDIYITLHTMHACMYVCCRFSQKAQNRYDPFEGNYQTGQYEKGKIYGPYGMQ